MPGAGQASGGHGGARRQSPARQSPTDHRCGQAWVVSLACQKAKDHGYPHELWTTRLLAQHIREHAEAAGYPCLARLAQGTVSKILTRHAVKPHKVRYYLERRDAAFDAKMADVLCVYREVAILQESDTAATNVAIISCDEKPGLQAIGNAAPDWPPQPGLHAAFARDHDDKRHGTLSLIAGIDLLTGVVHACVEDRHRSREFIGFLKRLDEAYPAGTAIRLILDNHSSHVSKETKAWLAAHVNQRANGAHRGFWCRRAGGSAQGDDEPHIGAPLDPYLWITLSRLLLSCLPEDLQVQQVLTEPDRIIIFSKPKSPACCCPLCGHTSERVHSHYLRTLADLPWQGQIAVAPRRALRHAAVRSRTASRH
jgi:DDE superfamily endonuclease